MESFHFATGATPLFVSMPHAGTYIPPEIAADMTPAALATPDTDWHVDRLYDFLAGIGASVLVATHSRYVIDLNRDPAGRPLYPGASNTELCPTTLFDEGPIYREGRAPDAKEIERRRRLYWEPYHDRLAGALDMLRERFGIVLLLDAHSIRSEVPRFFSGRLPDINIGTGDGGTAAPELAARMLDATAETAAYSSVLNGRFTGGFITRHYGRPNEGVHTVQIELSQATYMDEAPPFAFREDLAAGIRPVLKRLVETMLAFAREQATA